MSELNDIFHKLTFEAIRENELILKNELEAANCDYLGFRINKEKKLITLIMRPRGIPFDSVADFRIEIDLSVNP